MMLASSAWGQSEPRRSAEDEGHGVVQVAAVGSASVMDVPVCGSQGTGSRWSPPPPSPCPAARPGGRRGAAYGAVEPHPRPRAGQGRVRVQGAPQGRLRGQTGSSACGLLART